MGSFLPKFSRALHYARFFQRLVHRFVIYTWMFPLINHHVLVRFPYVSKTCSLFAGELFFLRSWICHIWSNPHSRALFPGFGAPIHLKQAMSVFKRINSYLLCVCNAEYSCLKWQENLKTWQRYVVLSIYSLVIAIGFIVTRQMNELLPQSQFQSFFQGVFSKVSNITCHQKNTALFSKSARSLSIYTGACQTCCS